MNIWESVGVGDLWLAARTEGKTCRRGHNLREHASVQFDGEGFPFVHCRECNRVRARAWRVKNHGRLVRRPGGGGQLRVQP